VGKWTVKNIILKLGKTVPSIDFVYRFASQGPLRRSSFPV